jgi:hypothetical protein
VTPGYSNRFSPDATTADSPIGKWMLSLTKYLWELGGKASDTSDVSLFRAVGSVTCLTTDDHITARS